MVSVLLALMVKQGQVGRQHTVQPAKAAETYAPDPKNHQPCLHTSVRGVATWWLQLSRLFRV